MRSSRSRADPEARRVLDEAGLPRRLRDRLPDRARALGLEYFGLGIPCPFLEDEACSMHADRPIACREYLVTSPAEHGASPSAESVRMVQLSGSASRARTHSRNPGASMRRLSLTAALFAATLTPAAASAQGSSDIFLVRLNTTGGSIAADSVIRVTNRNGYDNQPSFLRDGRTLLYTTIDAAGQADIRRHTLGTPGTSTLTVTAPESEYSPTQMPAGDRFSVIRVERDSTQRLWSFRLDGTDPRIVLEDVKPVGYHAWVDANRVAVFVLGSPATLQLVDLRGGSPVMIARDVGRALQPVPGRDAVSFVQRDSADTRWIEIYDVATRTVKRLIRPFAENEYHTWLPNGTLITARGTQLYQLDPATDTDWVPAADLASHGITDMSRLAISADGAWLAVVAAHAASGR